MEVESIQSVQMNTYQSNTYRKLKAGFISTMSQGFKREREREQKKDEQSNIYVSVVYLTYLTSS